MHWHIRNGCASTISYLHLSIEERLYIINTEKMAYRTFRVGFYTDEVRHCLASSVFYLFSKKIKGGQNELVKSPKMIAMTALIRVISF